MFSNELLERLHLVQKLQNELIDKFGDKDYNVFVFGSYLTERYIEGKSDIDIAIYTEDVSKYVDLSVYISEFWKKYNVPTDIFYIDVRFEEPIYYIPLKSPLRITDYYPNILKNFFEKCKSAYQKAVFAGAN